MRTFLAYLFLLSICYSCKHPGKPSGEGQADINQLLVDTNLTWSQRMANTVMHGYPELWTMEGRDKPKWSYTYGLVGLAFQKLWKVTDNNDYYEYAKAYADEMIDSVGNISTYSMEHYNIDHINAGNLLFLLYAKTGEQKYKNAMDTLREQLVEHPRTSEGGFWHKNRYPHQMWLDGLYMGAPFYAHYGKEFNQPENYDDVVNWITLMEKKARDEETGLLYHGWDESREQKWVDKQTGLSKNFWGRGMGWYGMALVDVLDYIPENHPGREEIISIIQRFADAIVKVQDETGCWYQVLDKGDAEDNFLEGSASSMFTYFFLKALKYGYIDESYKEPATKAYNGIINNLIQVDEDGLVTITPVCAVAGLGGDPYRDGTYEYYINEARRDNDPKAVGPFIMASMLYEEWNKTQ